MALHVAPAGALPHLIESEDVWIGPVGSPLGADHDDLCVVSSWRVGLLMRPLLRAQPAVTGEAACPR
jgi:hypothetical protein